MNEATADGAGRYTVFNAMVDIVAAPGRALDEARQHVRWLWWPLLVTLTAMIAVFVYYYTWVDFDWLVEELIRQNVGPGGDPAAAEQMRGFMSPGMQIGMTVVGIVVVTFIIYAIQSAYFHLVNKVTGNTELGYGHWFAFSAWTGFVGVFNALAVLVVILLADNNQLGPEALAPLSMNALFIHAEPGTSWATWGQSLTLVHFWMLGLMTIGFARWTNSSMAKSAVIAITPWALIFGIWAAMIA